MCYCAPVAKAWSYTDGPPLYGNLPYVKLAIPLPAQAIVAGSRHLFYDHATALEELSGDRSAAYLLRLHLKAHDHAEHTKVVGELPWNLVSGVHNLAD